MVLAILFAQGVQHSSTAVSAEFLADECYVSSLEQRAQHRLQSSLDPVGGTFIRLRRRYSVSEGGPQSGYVFGRNQQCILRILSQAGMHVDCNGLLRGGQTFAHVLQEQLRALFERLASKEQPLGVLVLAADNRLLQCGHSMAKDQRCRTHIEKIHSGSARRVQERMQTYVHWRRALIVPVDTKIPIEIDVVLIDAAQPCHSVRIKDMDDNDRGI